MPRPDDLPDYRQPPIDEVVLGLQFAPIVGFSELHTGLFWQTIREEYPHTQSQPRLEGPVEDLTAPPFTPPPPFMIPLGGAIQGRTWLISADDVYLLQIQDTRFIHNWRRREDEYPHLDVLRDRFWSSYHRFLALLDREKFSRPELQQLELVYINWIPGSGTPTYFKPAEASALSAPFVGPAPDDQSFGARYTVRDDDGVPVARLYAECQPAMRMNPKVNEGSVGTQFTLTFKAPVAGDVSEDVVNGLLSRGRETIVRSFTDLTTDAAHDEWGRYK